MEEFTFQEQLQLQNSREHLKVVTGNLRIASEELSRVLGDIKQSRTKLSESERERHNVLSEIAEKSKEFSETKSAQDKREASLLERENKSDEKEKETKERILIATQELDGVNRETSQIKSKNNDLINKYSSIIIQLEQKLGEILTSIKENEEINENKLGEQKKLENEITRIIEEKEKVQKEVNEMRKNYSDEMSKCVKLIQEEKNKIGEPLKLIKREQEKLDILRNDLLIIKHRLRQQYEQQNPEKIIPRELQEEK